MSLRQTSKTCHQASFWSCKDATFGINEFPRSAVQMKRISNLVPREKALETRLKNTRGHRVQIGRIVLTNSVSLQWKALLYVRYLAAKSRVYGFFVGLFTLNISNLILESLVKFVMVRIIKTPYSTSYSLIKLVSLWIPKYGYQFMTKWIKTSFRKVHFPVNTLFPLKTLAK